jgi:hypothetical protein
VSGIDLSDHWSFWQEGYPALMVTDTAPYRYPAYHTAADTPDKLDYDRLARVTAGLARVIAGYEKDAALPQSLETLHPLGPMEMPPASPERRRAKLEDVYALARAASEHIGRTGTLPATLQAGNARIGTGSLFALFSAVYIDLDSDKPRPEYDVPSFEPYPATNERKIIGEVEGYKSWPVHRPDLDMSGVVEFTKLQLWTLKPARRR